MREGQSEREMRKRERKSEREKSKRDRVRERKNTGRVRERQIVRDRMRVRQSEREGKEES